jgi:negative regulator of replication initiation
MDLTCYYDHITQGAHEMTESAVDRLNRLLRIIALGGTVREDVLQEAEQAVARMNQHATNHSS